MYLPMNKPLVTTCETYGANERCTALLNKYYPILRPSFDKSSFVIIKTS